MSDRLTYLRRASNGPDVRQRRVESCDRKIVERHGAEGVEGMRRGTVVRKPDRYANVVPGELVSLKRGRPL